MLTHCRACGIEKEEEMLFNCDWCGCRFCGLHYIMSEDICDSCIIEPSEWRKLVLSSSQIITPLHSKKVFVIYGVKPNGELLINEVRRRN